jgi:hypothetical protein
MAVNIMFRQIVLTGLLNLSEKPVPSLFVRNFASDEEKNTQILRCMEWQETGRL